MDTFEWEHFKDFADEISNNCSEVAQRTAIGRYYYASFCYSRQYLTDNLEKEEYGETEGIHARVIKYFANEHKLEEHGIIGTQLKRLRMIRNNSDYDIDFPSLNENTVPKAKQRADKVFKNINSLKSLSIPF